MGKGKLKLEKKVASNQSARYSYYDETMSLTGFLTEERVGMGILPPRRVGAEATYVQRVISTPQKAVRDVLKKTLGIASRKAQDKEMRGQSFYTLLLDFAVRIKDPVETFLEWARFTIELGSEHADIWKIAPDAEGIKTTLKKTGERNIAFSPSLEIGPSTKVVDTEKDKATTDTTSKEKEKTRETTMGAKFQVKFDYNNKKGFEIEVPKLITEIKGTKLAKNRVEWMIDGNREIRIPGEQIGLTSVVKASMIVQLPRNERTEAKVQVEGRVVRENAIFFIDFHGPVDLISPDKFPVKPR